MAEVPNKGLVDNWASTLKLVGASTAILVPLLYLMGACYRTGYFQAFGIPLALVDTPPIASMIFPRWTMFGLGLFAALSAATARTLSRIAMACWRRGRNQTLLLAQGHLESGMSALAFWSLILLDIIALVFAICFREVRVMAVLGALLGLSIIPLLAMHRLHARVLYGIAVLLFGMVLSFGQGMMDSEVTDDRLSVTFTTKTSRDPQLAELLATDGRNVFLLQSEYDDQTVTIIPLAEFTSMTFSAPEVRVRRGPQDMRQWLDHIRRHELLSPP